MPLPRRVRRLLIGYLAALILLAGMAAAVVLLGDSGGSALNGAVLFGLTVVMIAWLVIAYFASATPGSVLRPMTGEMVLLTRDPALVLPQHNPEVIEDLRDKLTGTGPDMTVFAAANVGLCLGLAVLFYCSPPAALVALAVAALALSYVVYSTA